MTEAARRPARQKFPWRSLCLLLAASGLCFVAVRECLLLIQARRLWKETPAEKDWAACVARYLGDYQVESVRSGLTGSKLTLQVRDNGLLVFTWKGHDYTVFTRSGGVLYLADYSPISTGCAVVAYDLKARRELWRTELEGIGGVSHSKYHNRVTIGLVSDGKVVVVCGDEGSGRYVERLNARTGEDLSNVKLDEAEVVVLLAGLAALGAVILIVLAVRGVRDRSSTRRLRE